MKKIGKPPTTAMVYIGNARYQLMDKIAREISFEAGYTVRSSTLVQYLIDNFSDSARVSILKDLSIRNEKV
ncbi:hypothetical protein IG808_004775 [Salmonella enterica]|nr:hypothetical protein [Salmonella enterica]